MITYELGKSNLPLYEELFERLKDDILSKNLKGKLPSKRELASHLNISITTVMGAYSELLAQGYIYSVIKKGYYVNSEISLIKKQKVKTNFTSQKHINLPNLSLPNLENLNFPFSTWKKLMNQNSPKFLQSVPFKGSFELRSAICNHLNEYLGIKTEPNLVVVGAGAEYLYTLIAQLLGTNKTYATQNPNHIKIRQIYESLGAKCISLEDINSKSLNGVDFLHISPTNHFPTGKTLSIQKRIELIKWVNSNKFIIEDNFSSEITLNGKIISSLKNLMPQKVVYVSTFSKTLLPTLRISYMVLPEELMVKFEKNLSFYSSTVPIFEQLTLAKFIQDGYFEKYLNRLKKLYKNKKTAILEELMKFNDEFNIKIFDSGLSLLIEFKENDETIRDKFLSFGYEINFVNDYYWDTKSDKSYAMIDFLNLDAKDIANLLYKIV